MLIDNLGSLLYNYLSPRYCRPYKSNMLYKFIYSRLLCAGKVRCGEVFIHAQVYIFLFMGCTTRQILIIFVSYIYVIIIVNSY